MSYNFSQNDIKAMFSNGFREKKIIFSDHRGFFETQKELVSNDIFIFKSTTFANDNVEFLQESLDEDFFSELICINFVLDGRVQISTCNQKDLFMEKSERIIASLRNLSGSFKVQKQTNCKTLSIQISKNFFDKNEINPERYFKEKLLKKTPLNLRVESLAKEVYCSSFDDDIYNIYLQSKILEIIFLEFSSHSKEKKSKEVKFSDYDKKALKKAKEILESSMSFPSIVKLSKMVHLNEFKLKIGFRKFFNQTPYQVSLRYRMGKAQEMLEKGELDIHQISQQIGYKYPQNFTATYSKYFGINPRNVKRNKKYFLARKYKIF